MKLCMIGAIGHNGYVFDGLAQRPRVELVGIAPGPHETDIRRLARQAERVNQNVKAYDDYRVMLDAERPDVVSVACHFHDHAAVTIDVLSRGIHAFVEKPLATTLEDLKRVEAAHEKSDAHLACMLGLRYAPAFLTGWRAVSHGAIGEVRLLSAQKSYKLGTRAEFYSARETYGGTIPWVGSHAIDWLHWYTGAAFERVYATHSTRGNRGHGDLEVSALCHFTMRGEIFGSVTMDYFRPPKAPSHGDDRLRVVGTGGVLEVARGAVQLIDDQGPRELGLEPPRSIFAEFVDQIRGEGICLVSAEDALLTTRACLLARQSADEARIVSI